MSTYFPVFISYLCFDFGNLYLDAMIRDHIDIVQGEEGEEPVTEETPVDESFDSLAKKLDKQKGIDKEEAAKIAGSIAQKKLKGAGKGPTAKQKARMAEQILKELRG